MVEWRIRVRGKQRQPVDMALVVRAVIMLGKQLERERREAVQQRAQPSEGSTPPQPEASA
jgi:hypothetical protein